MTTSKKNPLFLINSASLKLIAIAVVAFFAFFALTTNEPSMQSSQFFFSNILNALMGATVVAVVTSALFGYQAKIQADDEKRRAIFEKKLDLYQRLADTFKELSSDNRSSSKRIGDDLRPMLYEVVLLSGGSAGGKYLEVIDAIEGLDDPNYQLSVDDQKNIMNFFVAARDDLDVIENITDDNKNTLEAFLDSASDSSKIEARASKRFLSDSEKLALLKEYDEKPRGEKSKFAAAHNYIPADMDRFRKQLTKKGFME
jgi:hypothetical protein